MLVVEDNADLRRVLTGVLTDQGHTVDAAATGQQALALATVRSLDVVLLDLELGSASLLTGVQVCQHLRANGLAVPILFLSAQPAAEVEQAVGFAGASGYLLKPFRLASVLEHLAGHLPIPCD